MKFLGERYGIIREWLKDFTRDGEWKATRDQYIERFNFCECCGSDKELNVHHVFPVRWFPELELEPYNLITLCRKHHFYYGHLGDWKKWNPYVWEMAQLFQKGLGEYEIDIRAFKEYKRTPNYEDYLRRVRKNSGKIIIQGQGYDVRGQAKKV